MKVLALFFAFFPFIAIAQIDDRNVLDKLDPQAVDIEEQLLKMDAEYEAATGVSAILPSVGRKGTCHQRSCGVYIEVSRAAQTATLFVNGGYYAQWYVSTGVPGHSTPALNGHPNGRIYDYYMSRTYPGGDYNGLGNMPYAVFIWKGYAIHGTARSNWPMLGRRASHGCIRLHPDNARIFNRLVRDYGINQSWVTVL